MQKGDYLVVQWIVNPKIEFSIPLPETKTDNQILELSKTLSGFTFAKSHDMIALDTPTLKRIFD